MNIRSYIYICLTVLGAFVALEPRALAQTRLGLNVTQEELNIWRQGAQTGPYRTGGDVSTNSPGDWNSIISRAQQFVANPLMENWQGQTASGQWRPDGHSCNYTQGTGVLEGCVPKFAQGIWMLAAGFATLVDPTNHNYASQIRQALLAQITYSGTKFLDTSKWPDEQIGDAYSYMIAYWLTRLVYAYDYVRASSAGSVFSASERLAIETWFSNAAFYWAKNTHYLIANNAFPSRNSQFDTTVNVGGTYPTDIAVGNGPGGGNVTYFNCTTSQRGPFSGDAHSLWNNRSGSQIMFAAAGSLLNGKLPNDAQTQRWVKMWFKEWMTYSVYPDGTFHDWYRWASDNYNQGWVYSAIVIGSMSSTADMFARLGDTSLYNFSTSAGWVFSNNPSGYNGNTAGGTKTLLKTMLTHASLVPSAATHNPDWRAGDTSAVCSDSSKIISPTGANPSVHETHYAQANLYYKDSVIKSMYLRTATSAPAYPADPTTNSNAWGGVSAAYPGVLFMVGQMEGRVSPYGGAPASPPPPPQSPPTTSAIMVDSTFPGYSTSPVDDGVRDAFGGTATTWASGENSSAPHWVEIPLPSSQQINTATIHWAYNDTTYMTSQEMQVQYWNGSSFVTAATMTWPGKDVPSTTVTFPTVTTSKLRFYQPPNQGHPNYPEVIWLAEIDFGGLVAPNPAAPTNLVVAFE